MMTDQERDRILVQIDDKVDKLLQWKSALDVRCEERRRNIGSLQETLYANPHGLVKQVQMLVNCKTNINKWKDFWFFILRQALVAGIIGVTICLFKLFRLL